MHERIGETSHNKINLLHREKPLHALIHPAAHSQTLDSLVKYNLKHGQIQYEGINNQMSSDMKSNARSVMSRHNNHKSNRSGNIYNTLDLVSFSNQVKDNMNNTFDNGGHSPINIGYKTPGNFYSTENLGRHMSYGIDRNKISDEYENQNYPYFFKAVQPQIISNPNVAKGLKQLEKPPTKTAASAMERFNEEVFMIKKIREKQRYDFYKVQNDQQQFHLGKQQLQRQNNKYNSIFLQRQQEENQVRRKEEMEVARQFYKTHFGPEETDELV